MHKLLLKLIIILVTLFNYQSLYSAQKKLNSDKNIFERSEEIKNILKDEKSIKHLKKINSIIEYIDQTYSNLYDKLNNGKKIVIFFDPAHGKLSNNKWQGNVTWRQSCTNRPEEFYSTILSRKLYTRLIGNNCIEVKSTSNFMKLLKNESNSYKNIKFTKTIKLAKKNNAFLIVSQHLNNVSPRQKADGLVALKGIHITCNKFGKRLLSNVKGVHQGFLTLYNKLDITGLSLKCASNLKDLLVAENLKPATWGKGTVADDRFTYFVNFPISVIFESGFISNPEEEYLFRNDENYQNTIVDSQYSAIISSIKNTFGIDISSGKPEKIRHQSKEITNLLKLSRIVIYYIQNMKINKAINVCTLIEKKYIESPYKTNISPYVKLKDKLIFVRSCIRKANFYKPRRQFTKACKLYRKAIYTLDNNPLFLKINKYLQTSHNKIAHRTRPRLRRIYLRRRSNSFRVGAPPKFRPLRTKIEKHSIRTPFILAIENNDLETAIENAFAPNEKIKSKILKVFKRGKVTKNKWKRVYSKKKKKYIWKKYRKTKYIRFTDGIYVVKLNSKFNLVRVKKVKHVAFNPRKYQNQQYFKNSCLAKKTKHKSI